ncbi:MAG: neutral/alkaline non-lysosomal ceramidase N-terminal domain-containing protein [Anaeromyxobacter sp.]
MKKLPARLLLVVAVLCGLVAAAVALLSLPWVKMPALTPPRVEAKAGDGDGFLAGAGVAPIELPADAPIGGFGRWSYTAQGVRDPVTARAVVLTSPGHLRIGLVSAEILLVPEALEAAVQARVRGLALDGLIVAATHTHASPGGYWENLAGERIALGPYRAELRDRIANAMAQALRKAAAEEGPAALSVGRAEGVALSRNRDGGEVDQRLTVVRLTRPDGAPVAELALFAAHPTTLGKRNRQISGDWPGRFLAGEGQGVRLFFQGSLGDQSVQLPPGQPPATPESYAAALEAAVAQLAFSPPDAEPELGYARATENLPLPAPAAVPALARRAATTVAAPLMPTDAEVSALRLGPVLLLAVPAEPTAAVGAAWRAAAGPGAEVLSLADGYVGYVETAERVREGEGEAHRQYFGPELAERLQEAVALASRTVNGAVAQAEAERRVERQQRAAAEARAREAATAQAAAAAAQAKPAAGAKPAQRGAAGGKAKPAPARKPGSKGGAAASRPR